jgi:murein DD-endopeptidase
MAASSAYGRPGQEISRIHHVPLAYEVLFPPTPFQAEGMTRLVYELHLTSFSKSPLTLESVEVLGPKGIPVTTYQGGRLSDCLTRPGKPPDLKDKAVLESGAQAVLFVMLTFKKGSDVPDSLAHRVTIEYRRTSGEVVRAQGEGGRVLVGKDAPIVIGPPLRPGVWLAGNCTGDGPVGHRNSIQPWDGRLVVSQRYAADLMKFGDDFRLTRGQGLSNPDWHGYGEEVLAVADGVVSDTKDGIVENTPQGPYAVPTTIDYVAGNYVVLEIKKAVFAVYAHLKPGSLRVKPGDRVRKGQVLGLIGNSGQSDAPHLHFHLISANPPFGGEGLPFVFERFDLLGPFESLDENLDKAWAPKGPASPRTLEAPLGDVVIRFPPVK